MGRPERLLRAKWRIVVSESGPQLPPRVLEHSCTAASMHPSNRSTRPKDQIWSLLYPQVDRCERLQQVGLSEARDHPRGAPCRRAYRRAWSTRTRRVMFKGLRPSQHFLHSLCPACALPELTTMPRRDSGETKMVALSRSLRHSKRAYVRVPAARQDCARRVDRTFQQGVGLCSNTRRTI